ncbi:retinoid-inducible serine carboxypeptidase [Manduca sexta]|uniref:retinoid-inducible serine carboxypeptidase n=1 Tax=Manduca sexta TaxID=7130 RepID=UPI001183210A|nr:retinoid-inducible serine carboxypeptidase [Manduca sexta]
MFTIFVLVISAMRVTGEFLPEELNPYIQALKAYPLARQYSHGYLETRPGAHFFYWFYYADGKKIESNQKPLIIWIQGGPGFAASGVGNFGEFGPLNMDLEPRNHTWMKGRNVLLIDHPAGVGFSYVTNKTLLATSDRDVALDLCRAIKLFFKRHKQYRKTPTYLIGQSYGGKIVPRLGLYLHTAIKKKGLKINFKGIAIGGGWVNPKESTLSQPDFLYFMGFIDRDIYLTTTKLVQKLAQSIETHNYFSAGALDTLIFTTFNEEGEINFNNLKTPSPYPALTKLNSVMNLYVKPTLFKVNQTLKWKYLSTDAYYSLKSNFLMPSTSFLERLLNQTNLKIVVYNGNLDAVAPLAAASNWVHKLNWHGAKEFNNVKRNRIAGERNGFYKEVGQLSFWSVFEAGHWVPEENPEAMEQILTYFTK